MKTINEIKRIFDMLLTINDDCERGTEVTIRQKVFGIRKIQTFAGLLNAKGSSISNERAQILVREVLLVPTVVA